MRRNAFAHRLLRLIRAPVIPIDGFHMVGYARGQPNHVASLLARGDYEAPERHALKQILRPDDRVLEIGTCIGLIALTAARIVGAANVVTFEPNPDAVAVAIENFRQNGLPITVHNAAVDLQAGEMHLSVGSDSWLGASSFRTNNGPTHVVAVESIVDVVRAFEPTVLVIDAEGSEQNIVPAIPFEGLRAVMVEFHPDVIGGQAGIEKLRMILSKAGLVFRDDLAMEMTEVWERANNLS